MLGVAESGEQAPGKGLLPFSFGKFENNVLKSDPFDRSLANSRLPLADGESVYRRDGIDLREFGSEPVSELVNRGITAFVPDPSEYRSNNETKNERKDRQDRDDQDLPQITHVIFRLSVILRVVYTTVRLICLTLLLQFPNGSIL